MDTGLTSKPGSPNHNKHTCDDITGIESVSSQECDKSYEAGRLANRSTQCRVTNQV